MSKNTFRGVFPVKDGLSCEFTMQKRGKTHNLARPWLENPICLYEYYVWHSQTLSHFVRKKMKLGFRFASRPSHVCELIHRVPCVPGCAYWWGNGFWVTLRDTFSCLNSEAWTRVRHGCKISTTTSTHPVRTFKQHNFSHITNISVQRFTKMLAHGCENVLPALAQLLCLALPGS